MAGFARLATRPVRLLAEVSAKSLIEYLTKLPQVRHVRIIGCGNIECDSIQFRLVGIVDSLKKQSLN